MSGRPHVVIVGAGFGGLACVQALARAQVQITLIDRQNHHLFQPLLYQVAVAGLNASQVAVPIRSIVHKQRNVRVLLGEVQHVDLEARRVSLDPDLRIAPLRYDYLVLAPGAAPHYCGQERKARFAPALKSLDDAHEIRRRILLALEAAEHEANDSKRAQLLSFVIVGGGPTGIELAAAVAELAQAALERDFHTARPEDVRVLVLERGQRILPAYAPELADYAVAQLGELGVHVRTSTIVETVEPWGVTLRSGERLRADNVFWAAGITGSPLLAALSPDLELDRRGRALVLGDCSLPGFGEAFVIGDAACMFGALGAALPSVTAAAQQAGQHVGKIIAAEVADPRPSARPAFAYVDRGSTLTLGRGCAILQHQRKRMVGSRAWFAWVFTHVFKSIVWDERLRTLLAWAVAYVTYGRGARVITGTESAPIVQAPLRSEVSFHEVEDTEVRLAN